MAFRSWLKLLAATTTAAAVVGAGQLGIAYGLGMVRLDQTLELTQRDQWTAQLAWVAWITMTAAAIGAVVATGLRPRWSPRPVTTGGALGMGVAAGVGALAVLPLTMQPARSAQVAGVQPVLVIGICAGLGAAVGIFAGYAAAARAVARWSLSTLTIAMWAVALISVAPSLLPGHTQDTARLGVLDGDLVPGAVAGQTPFVTMPVIALIAGLITGWIARGRKMPTLTVALSGLAGPALLTVAYLIAGPSSGGGFHLDPYWGAMIASGAGVLGSVLAAIVRGAPEPARTPEPESPGDDSPADAKPEPAPITASGRATLPRRDAPVQSAIAQAAAAAARRPENELRPSDTGVIPVAAAERPHPLQHLAAAGIAPVTVHPPTAEPRFSGQQQQQAARAGGGLRRGWRTRKPAPELQPVTPPPAPTGDTGSFNGFAATQPGPRTGIDTAEHPRVVQRAPLVPEPTPISAPLPHPTPIAPPPVAPPAARGPRDRKEEDYVDWVNGLGG
jgi:MFS family permease